MQRSIELFIGKLITDEDFRRAFQRDPQATLEHAEECGFALNAYEIRILLATDSAVWDRMADELDSRLQKASLKNEGAQPS